MTYVRKDYAPVITVQGSNDNTLPVADNQRLTDALKAAGAEADIHLVDGAGHGYRARPEHGLMRKKTTFDWLAKHNIISSADAAPVKGR